MPLPDEIAPADQGPENAGMWVGVPVEDAALLADAVAVLFAASGPLGLADLGKALAVGAERAERICRVLHDQPPLGLALQRHAEQVQLTTAPSSAEAVERYLGTPAPVRLSRAALEALAVVAYRQPVTRAEIDAIRGVNSDSAVSTLLQRGLIVEAGRRETVGRPALLETSPEFLQYLGLSSLDQLPSLPDTTRRDESAA